MNGKYRDREKGNLSSLFYIKKQKCNSFAYKSKKSNQVMECIENLRLIKIKRHLVNSIKYVWLDLLKYSSQCWILDAKSKIDKKNL